MNRKSVWAPICLTLSLIVIASIAIAIQSGLLTESSRAIDSPKLTPVAHAFGPKPGDQAYDDAFFLIELAYHKSGWSETDAAAIAKFKVQSIILNDPEYGIKEFKAQDAPGGLVIQSDAVAVIEMAKEDHFAATPADASFEAWALHDELVLDYDGAYQTPPDMESGSMTITCSAYRVRYTWCEGGVKKTATVYWNAPCFQSNYINNPCYSQSCECPEGFYCNHTQQTSGACRGVPAGACIFVQPSYVTPFEKQVPCNRIVGDNDGGCADCSPPPPTGSEDPCVNVYDVCLPLSDQPCPSCQ